MAVRILRTTMNQRLVLLLSLTFYWESERIMPCLRPASDYFLVHCHSHAQAVICILHWLTLLSDHSICTSTSALRSYHHFLLVSNGPMMKDKQHSYAWISFVFTYLQWTEIGPSCPNCSFVLCTWPMKSMNPSPDLGTPCSGQSVNWNCLTVRDCPSFNERHTYRIWKSVGRKTIFRVGKS